MQPCWTTVLYLPRSGYTLLVALSEFTCHAFSGPVCQYGLTNTIRQAEGRVPAWWCPWMLQS